jgi:hypothetical protein
MKTREEYVALVNNYATVLRAAMKASVRTEETFSGLAKAKQDLIDFYDTIAPPPILNAKPMKDIKKEFELPLKVTSLHKED